MTTRSPFRRAVRHVLACCTLLLLASCGNNRDFSRGEMKPYIAAQSADVPATVEQRELPAR